jgi:peptide/nickel transport system substrate-binding protein
MGVLAETNKELTFTTDKADALQVEWMSYIAGPSLDILKKYMDQATADNYIPYAATLGQYVKASEAKARWANIGKWYATYNHFWIGTGPFYLESVHPVESTLTLQRSAQFPDKPDKWSQFTAPKLAVTEITGPSNVKIGAEATFDVSVTYRGAAYPQAEISGVKYLLYNANGDLVATGEAAFVEAGKYKIVLPANVTSTLTAGSTKLEVAVTSLVVSIPSFASIEFVTAP